MADVVIRCRENGPLVVTGPVTVIDHRGNAFPITSTKGNVALCRCGHSAQKPFCDGSHRDRDFAANNLATPEPPRATGE